MMCLRDSEMDHLVRAHYSLIISTLPKVSNFMLTLSTFFPHGGSAYVTEVSGRREAAFSLLLELR